MHVRHCVLCPWKLASWPVIKARWPWFTNYHRKSLASTKYPFETSVASSVSALDSWDSLTPAASSWLPIWEGTLKHECWLVPSALQLSGHALSLHSCKRTRVSLLSKWSDACWDEKPNSFQMSSIYLCHQHSWNSPALSPCIWAVPSVQRVWLSCQAQYFSLGSLILVKKNGIPHCVTFC